MLKNLMYKRNSIILIPFPFTDLSSPKIRPALQLSNQTDDDIIFCAISTKKHSSFDIPIKPNKVNGLKALSYIRTNKIATIESRLVLARLGDIDSNSASMVKKKLKIIFNI